MSIRRFFLLGAFPLAALLTGPTSAANETWQIHGQVVDEQNNPVNDFEAGTFWSSNGRQWDDTGKILKTDTKEDIARFWQREGEPACYPSSVAKHHDGNKFTVEVGDRPRISVFVIDKEHQRGGLASVEKPAAGSTVAEVTVKLVRLTRVHGKIDCPDVNCVPEWTMAIVHPVADKENYLQFIQCGSNRGMFSFLLPPGKYDLVVDSSSPQASLPVQQQQNSNETATDLPPRPGMIRVDVPAQPDLDLGTLHVEMPRDENGNIRSYYLYYGKEPPPLTITDARGISKNVKLADHKGKWVLLDFWALWCGPCVYNSIPELTKFYEDHAADRDRFEILAICNTEEEKATTLEAYDKAAEEVMKDAWHGKAPTIPILIDDEGKTSYAYGITAWPTTLLIDPTGHLVKDGDETTLAKELAEASRK